MDSNLQEEAYFPNKSHDNRQKSKGGPVQQQKYK